MKKFTLGLVLGILVSLSTLAPAIAGVREDVAEMMEQTRKGESRSGKNLRKAPLGEVVAELRKYVNDPSDRVRMDVADMATFLAIKHSDRVARRQAAQLVLAIAAADPDSGLASRASGKLATFSSADFTPEMKKVIANFLGRDNTYAEDVRLAGAAEVWAAEKKLREMAERNYWPARLALARMGDKAEARRVIEEIEAEKDAGRKVLRTEDLGYIRQPEAVEVLVRWLFRDDAMHPGASDVGAAMYATLAIEQLAEIIEGLSFPEAYGIYGMAEIKQVREWFKKDLTKLKIKR